MNRYFRKTFGLSEEGARGLVKASNWMAISNMVIMFLNALGYWFLRDSVMPALEGRPLHFKVLAYLGFSLFMFATMTYSLFKQYDINFVEAYEESANKRISLAERLRVIPLSFFGKKDIADLTTTIMTDVKILETSFSHFVPELFGSIISTTVIALSVFLFDFKIGLAMFWVIPVSFGLCILSRKVQNMYMIRTKDIQLSYLDNIQECVENIKDIKSNNREKEHLKEIEDKLSSYEKSSVIGELVVGIFVSSAQMILRIGMGTTIMVASTMLLGGGIDVLGFIVTLMVVTRIYEPLNGALINLAAVYNSLLSVERMSELENEKNQTGKDRIDNDGYDIKFEDVVFGYEDKTVLKGVSFTAKQGEVTALVGPSGGGKSTAIKLASRFWDIDGGKISLGGDDIGKIHPETLLENISIVFQDVILFNSSVMENIRIGNKNASDEEVKRVAKEANCHDFIMTLPNGYDTLIGENGSSLSGGERQRLSIARALLKDAPIVLLDEATSSLDIKNETKIQSAISRLIEDKTVIVIAHRMRTIASADKIVLLKDGKVNQEGTHESLIGVDGEYSKMIKLQTDSISWKLS